MIEDVALYRLQVPLKKPYSLAFGPVHHFDTILVCIIADGRAGYGEATILTGYTHEDIASSWHLVQSLSAALPGKSCAAAKAALDESFSRAPFTVTALITAIEMCEGSSFLEIATPTEVSMLAAVEGTGLAEIESEVERHLAAGFHTLKIKVGFDPDQDASRVASIQRLVRGRAALRIDANQGYSADEACRFAAKTDPAGIQLFEQPCAANDWEANAVVANASPLPLMLDESIYDEGDIDRAAALKSVAFVKLKLMKLGSLARLDAGLKRIRDLGMEPVLGNGVATELGCWMEACVARRRINNAGEMNGFLRQKVRLAPDTLPVRNGHIVLDGAPVFDMNAVESVAVGRARYARQRVMARG